MNNKIKPLARKNDIVVQEADGEILVYDLATNKASCLNDTAAFVWQNCDGSNDISDIARALGRKTNNEVSDDFVWLAIDALSKKDLFEEAVSVELSMPGTTRREVIKKIGLASMVALPIIATMVAPSSAHAASSCVPVTGGCACPGNGTVGAVCPGGTGCAANCNCQRANNGGGNNGNCVA